MRQLRFDCASGWQRDGHATTRVRMQFSAAQIDHLTGRQSDRQALDIVSRRSIFESAGARSIGRYVAAEKTTALGWIGRIQQSFCFNARCMSRRITPAPATARPAVSSRVMLLISFNLSVAMTMPPERNRPPTVPVPGQKWLLEFLARCLGEYLPNLRRVLGKNYTRRMPPRT